MSNRLYEYQRELVLPEIALRILKGRGSIETLDGHYVLNKTISGKSIVNSIDFKDAEKLGQLYLEGFGKDSIDFDIDDLRNFKKARDVMDRMGVLVSQIPYRKPKRSIFVLNQGKGCGMWRMAIPAQFVSNDDVAVYFMDNNNFELTSASDGDCIFCQWIVDHSFASQIAEAKKRGCRIVYDMDDSYIDVAPDNPAKEYTDACSMASIYKMVLISDCITTTNNYLAEKIREYYGHENVMVIPNSLDVHEQGWRPLEKCNSKDNVVRIFWSGGHSHKEDLEVCFEAIDQILQNYQNTEFITAGYLHPKIEEFKRTRRYWRRHVDIGGANEYVYFEALKDLDADIGIAPIVDSEFNKAKSNIKFIEYTMCWMPTVASRVGPYEESICHKEDGFLPKNNTQDWYSCLSKLVESKGRRIEMVKKAREKVFKNWDINGVKDLWVKALIKK